MIDLELRATKRMTLARMTPGDLHDFLDMHRDPRVMATLGGMQSDDSLRAAFDRHLLNWHEHGFGWWTARDKTSGRYLGRGGLRRCDVENAPEIEVGYGFVHDAWGRGLATELAAESIDVAFDLLGIDSLVSFTMTTNLASRRVMEKNGFVFERFFTRAELPHVLLRLPRAHRLPRTR